MDRCQRRHWQAAWHRGPSRIAIDAWSETKFKALETETGRESGNITREDRRQSDGWCQDSKPSCQTSSNLGKTPEQDFVEWTRKGKRQSNGFDPSQESGSERSPSSQIHRRVDFGVTWARGLKQKVREAAARRNRPGGGNEPLKCENGHGKAQTGDLQIRNRHRGS